MTVVFNVYRKEKGSSDPFIKIGDNLLTRAFLDTDVELNKVYLYKVGAVKNTVEKISEELEVHTDEFILTVEVSENGNFLFGETKPTSNVSVDVDESLKARALYDGSAVRGKALPNATITIEVED